MRLEAMKLARDELEAAVGDIRRGVGPELAAAAVDAVPVGELKWVEIDENGHLFVKRDGRYTAVGTDHGAPTHGIYLLSVDETGALLKDVNGQWLAATVVA